MSIIGIPLVISGLLAVGAFVAAIIVGAVRGWKDPVFLGLLIAGCVAAAVCGGLFFVITAR